MVVGGFARRKDNVKFNLKSQRLISERNLKGLRKDCHGTI